jgi:hypothetical protein
MIQERNEASNRALEIDVVLPERVIGINEQGLGAVLSVHVFHDSACCSREKLRFVSGHRFTTCGSPASYQGIASAMPNHALLTAPLGG